MEGLKTVVRDVLRVDCTGEQSLTAVFGNYTVTVKVDEGSKSLTLISSRPVPMNAKDGARKAQVSSLHFLPGVVIYSDECFNLVSSTVFLDFQQAEEMLRAMLEIHRDRVDAMYQKFMEC